MKDKKGIVIPFRTKESNMEEFYATLDDKELFIYYINLIESLYDIQSITNQLLEVTTNVENELVNRGFNTLDTYKQTLYSKLKEDLKNYDLLFELIMKIYF